MRIVVLTGAGMSAESGIPTFRGEGGLWEGFRPEEVASLEAWERDPELVLRFYNMRKGVADGVEPNAGHRALADLEAAHSVTIITQNVDDLHERAGSTDVRHLHGEIVKIRSCEDPGFLEEWGDRELQVGDLCPAGGQLRPHIVWFGEDVPEFPRAIPVMLEADLLFVVGTSMQVYPAAGLVDFVRPGTPIYVVNPDAGANLRSGGPEIQYFPEAAAQALPRIVAELLGDK